MASGLLLTLALLSAPACTVLYGDDSARQCESDADCAAQPALRGRTCNLEHGVCVALAASLPVVEACDSTELCTRQNSNKPAICRGGGDGCVRLETPDCPSVAGDWSAPDALIIGSIGPHTQLVAGSRERLQLPYVPRLIDAMNLAVEEWRLERTSGAPAFRRPLAIVHCDSSADPGRAARAMRHLVEDIGTPLVLAVSDHDVGAVADIAAESGAVLSCVACYARRPSQGLERPLVWQIQPPLEDQAALAARRVLDLEGSLRARGTLPEGALMRVALLSQSYPGISRLADRTRSLLRFNGERSVAENAAEFLELQTPDPRYEQFSQPMVARQIAAFAPHVIVVAVDADFTTYHLRLIEQEWPAGLPRPFYVASSMNQEIGLLAPIVGNDDDLRARLSGTTLYPVAEVAENLDGFASRFRRRYQREHDNTHFGYDAVYVASYALAVSALQPGQRLGPAAFRALMAGPNASVGPSSIPSALAQLVERQAIDLAGTSSLLDWDASGEVSSDVGVWCLSRRSDGELTLVPNAGQRWSHASSEIIGAYSCPRDLAAPE